MLKSTHDRYGSMAVSIHWLSSILILAMLASGFVAEMAPDSAAKAAVLRFHIPVAVVVLLLTVLRLVWWWRFDRRPLPERTSPRWQQRVAQVVHAALYVVVLGMLASGLGMMILSGAAPAVLGTPGTVLPDFNDYAPRVPHGLGALLLIGLLAFHAGAALYHTVIRRDGLLRRMWYGS